MKWGIRRYQNEDGTLTEAGKKRYDRNYNYVNNAKKVSENTLQVINSNKTYNENAYTNMSKQGYKAYNQEYVNRLHNINISDWDKKINLEKKYMNDVNDILQDKNKLLRNSIKVKAMLLKIETEYQINSRKLWTEYINQLDNLDNEFKKMKIANLYIMKKLAKEYDTQNKR